EEDIAGSLMRGMQGRQMMNKQKLEEQVPGMLEKYKAGDEGVLLQIANANPQLAGTLLQMSQAKEQSALHGLQMESTRLDIARAKRDAALAGYTQEVNALSGFKAAIEGVESDEQKRKIQNLYIKDAEAKSIKVPEVFKRPWDADMDGDIDHVLTIGRHMLGQTSKDFIKVGKDETLIDPRTMKPVFTSGGGVAADGPFDGTSMDAQTANILLKGDPASPEYLAAYNIAAQPKTVMGPDGAPQTVNPDMSAYRKPTGAAGAAAGQMGDRGGVAVGDPSLTKIPGLDLAEGARPTPQDAKAVKDILEAKKNIAPLMAARAKILSADPNPIAGTQNAIKLDQNTAQLALKLKGLEQTGALDKGSVDVMMDAIGDPQIRGEFTSPVTSITKSVAKTRGGKKLTDDLLESGNAYIENTLQSAIESRGYKAKTKDADADGPPKGIDSRLWEHMTPEERKLFK
ncbi:hypothetical protein KW797_01995, partial [Candidatus Parcubacteria bacterium]|nr:hypothetical protein [Candidatus Parcubacteria bacterium]